MNGLVYWTEDNSTSIIPEERIPEESRFKGSLAQVKWDDGRCYPGLIICLGNNLEVLKKKEEEFLVKLNKMGPKKLSKENLSQPVETLRKKLQAEKRVHSAAVSATEQEEDMDLVSHGQIRSKRDAAKRILFDERHSTEKENKTSKLPEKTCKGKTSAVQTMKKKIPDNPSAIIKKKISDNSSAIIKANDKTELDEIAESDDASTGSSSDVEHLEEELEANAEFQQESNCCGCCKKLHKSVSYPVVNFLNELCGFVGLNQLNKFSVKCLEPKQSSKEYLAPLPIPSGIKQVPIAKGSGLYLSKVAKAKIVVESENDPYKLTRKVLTELFGSRLCEQGLSARGKGTPKAIDDTYLQAIYAFVSSNSNVKDPPGKTRGGKPRKHFSYTVFIREVNRKLESARRHSAEGGDKRRVFGSQKKPHKIGTSWKTANSPAKSADSPRKTANSPRKTADSPRKTPDSRRKAPDSPRKTPDSRRKSPDSRRKTPDSRRKTPNSCRKSPDSRRKTADSPRKAGRAPKIATPSKNGSPGEMSNSQQPRAAASTSDWVVSPKKFTAPPSHNWENPMNPFPFVQYHYPYPQTSYRQTYAPHNHYQPQQQPPYQQQQQPYLQQPSYVEHIPYQQQTNTEDFSLTEI